MKFFPRTTALHVRAFESLKQHHGVENCVSGGEQNSGGNDDVDERICRARALFADSSSEIRVDVFRIVGDFIVEESVFHKPPNVPERVFLAFKHSARDKKHRRADATVRFRV